MSCLLFLPVLMIFSLPTNRFVGGFLIVWNLMKGSMPSIILPSILYIWFWPYLSRNLTQGLPSGLSGINADFSGVPQLGTTSKFLIDDFAQLSGQRPNCSLVRPSEIDALVSRRKRLEVIFPCHFLMYFESKTSRLSIHMSEASWSIRVTHVTFLLLRPNSFDWFGIELKLKRNCCFIKLSKARLDFCNRTLQRS